MNWNKFGIDISKMRNGKTFCPRCHDERKKQGERELSIDKEKGLFNCHHCGFHGTANEYEQAYKPQKIYRRPSPKKEPPTSKVIQWFSGRGICEKTLTAALVTEAVEWMPQVDAKRNCICFPYYRGGELINIKYRDAEKNFKLEKDAELILFGLDTIKDGTQSAIITEGEIDALTLIEIGITSGVLSVPNGASKGNQRLEYIDNCWQDLEALTEIIIATDTDAPGLALRDELARRLGADRCLFVEYPAGSKDFNELFLKPDGRNAVLQCLKDAKPFPLHGVQNADDLYHETLAILQNGYPTGLKSGWEGLDDLLRWDSNGFTVITGIPGHGKSTWLNNLLIRMAERHNWRVGMFTPEMQPSKVLMAQLCELKTGKGMRRDMTLDDFNLAMAWLAESFWIMKIDEIDVSMDGILEKAAELVKYHGINALVIDPWNYVEHKRPAGQDETSYISEALTKIKRFKNKYDVHVFIIAHPTKIKKNEAGIFLTPNLYDIAGSAHWYNKADNGIVVYKNATDGTVEIFVQKVRWWFLGQTGSTQMFYDKSTRKFSQHISNQFPT